MNIRGLESLRYRSGADFLFRLRWVRSSHYNMGDNSLEKLLQSIDRPGDFFAYGRLLIPMPVLKVDGVGLLSFPVPDAQVRALMEVAERAPYGKGTETLVDTSVRDCRQIDAAQVCLGGRAWPDTFSKILAATATGLGCPLERLDAQLYKLLVYPSGGFFSSHRDTAKADGMIATLSISLPTAGAGGELIVRHCGREMTLDMNADEPSELAFAAFYADCSHETLPIRHGHRLSLVFNVCLRPGDTETPRLAPDYSDRVESVADFLIDWRDGDHPPDKYVWLMEHDYSESGLSFDALKNADASVARVLKAAADLAEWELYLAIVHVREAGIPVLYYVEEDWDEMDSDPLEMDELLDRTRSLDGWMDRDGGRPPFGKIPLLGQELLPEGALDAAEPDDQRVHEATGNAGMTIEQFYRRAAFVIWPRPKTLDVISSGGIDRGVAWVAEQFQGEDLVPGQSIGDLVGRLTEIWPTGRYVSDGEARSGMLRLLAAIGDETRTAHFLRQVVVHRYDGSENDDLLAALVGIGPDAGGKFLVEFVKAQLPYRTGDTLVLLRRVGETAGPAWSGALRGGARQALADWPAVLKRVKRPVEADRTTWAAEEAWDDEETWEYRERERKSIDHGAIRDLFGLASRFGLAEDAKTAAVAIADHPQLITPDRMVPAALDQLRGQEGIPGTGAYALLWRHAVGFLLRRSATAPEVPRDWTIPTEIDCDCRHCAKLRAFCRNPVAKTERFKLRKDLRKHLHRIIDGHRLDMSHVTQRKGSPYTLVCTKNRASYGRRLNEYGQDVSWMRSLIRSAPCGEWTEVCAAELERLHDAVAESE